MRVVRVIGDLGRGLLVYLLTAYGAAGTHGLRSQGLRSPVLDPVGPASAEDNTPDPHAQTDTFAATCDDTYVRDGVKRYFAKHVFDRPRPARELAGTRVLALNDQQQGVPGYTYQLITKGIFVRDGAVAIECGDETTGRSFDHVLFVTPRAYKLEIDPSDPW